MSLESRFSPPALHHLVIADDFWDSAAALRAELLTYAAWGPMTQYGRSHESAILPHRQNGISASNLLESDHASGTPQCRAFSNFLRERSRDLAHIVGVDAPDLDVELSAMAYGEHAWLSPHTDYRDDEARPHLVAWMLYLTHPADGEWTEDKGGALRLTCSSGGDVRLRPRFNRFAMFKVSDDSLHEIEAVTWSCGWEHCRLALSGWLRGPENRQERRTRIYRKTASFAAEREKQEAWLRGSLAMYRLLRTQLAYGGHETVDVDVKIAQYVDEYEANGSAPDGTVFVRNARGPGWCIVVVDDQEKVVYFGPGDGYRD
jgi:hypothetical protein